MLLLHLSMALAAAQVVFIAGIDAVSNKVGLEKLGAFWNDVIQTIIDIVSEKELVALI